MSIKRRKGVAIVNADKGILVVAGKSKNFTLPGGGAEKWESRKKATIRELYEETGLKTKNIVYLFRYTGNKWHTHSGKVIRNYAKVFLVEAIGNPKPKHEIKKYAFWKPGSSLNLTRGTKKIIEKYLSKKLTFNSSPHRSSSTGK
jgi:ADP-ribose pyrophosphatase YjhB (NUDIX family)